MDRQWRTVARLRPRSNGRRETRSGDCGMARSRDGGNREDGRKSRARDSRDADDFRSTRWSRHGQAFAVHSCRPRSQRNPKAFRSPRIRGKWPQTEKRVEEAQRYSNRTEMPRPAVRPGRALRDGECASYGTFRLRANSAFAPASVEVTPGRACSDLGRNRLRSPSLVLIGSTALAVNVTKRSDPGIPSHACSFDRQTRGAGSLPSRAGSLLIG